MRSMVFARKVLFGLSLTLVAAVPFVPRASAAPCCSAPICQRDIPPPICAACGNCAADDPAALADDADFAHDFDADAGVCHALQ